MEIYALTDQIRKARNSGDPELMALTLDEVSDALAALQAVERGPADKLNAKDYVFADFAAVLEESGIRSGRIAELGGPQNSIRDFLPDFEITNLSLFEVPGDESVVLADITQCPQIPDSHFDAVFSMAVFEHVERPWQAAEEIVRILKPGGVTYHSAPFSYFFHGAPMDFWRFTPDAFGALFPELAVLRAELYGTNRRRNNMGSPANPVDRDGGEAFAVDAFGGWRENWTALYAGRKTEDASRELRQRRRRQLAIDIVAALESTRPVPDSAFERAAAVHAWLRVSPAGDLRLRSRPETPSIAADRVRWLWRQRKKLGLSISPMRGAVASLLPPVQERITS